MNKKYLLAAIGALITQSIATDTQEPIADIYIISPISLVKIVDPRTTQEDNTATQESAEEIENMLNSLAYSEDDSSEDENLEPTGDPSSDKENDAFFTPQPETNNRKRKRDQESDSVDAEFKQRRKKIKLMR